MDRDRAFDNESFFAALDVERVSRKMNWRAVAAEAGVNASTLTRIGQGRRPDVDSFAALAAWANLKPENFFLYPSEQSDSSLDEISLLLRRDPNLSAEAATALDELVKVTYKRLQQNP